MSKKQFQILKENRIKKSALKTYLSGNVPYWYDDCIYYNDCSKCPHNNYEDN